MKINAEAAGAIAIAVRRNGSLTAIVRKELERMIVGGDLKAGERLNEQRLATQLGVSRGPVREALRALEQDGLVTAVVNLGVFVRQVGIDEAVEMYDMRALVFAFACARLARSTDADQQAELAALVAEMDAIIARGDRLEYYRLNLRFHDLIMEFSDHRRATQIYQSLVKEGHLLRQRSLQPVESMRQSNSEHAAILAAIVADDCEAARAAAEAHHMGGKRRWLDTLGR